MKIPSFKMISREDFKEAPQWINQLLIPLNSWMQDTNIALSGNLSFGDNVQGSIKTVTFKTSSTYTSFNWTPVSLLNPLNKKVDVVTIGQIQKVSDQYQPIYLPTSVDWIQLNSNIVINYISGLENSTSYVVKLLIL